MSHNVTSIMVRAQAVGGESVRRGGYVAPAFGCSGALVLFCHARAHTLLLVFLVTRHCFYSLVTRHCFSFHVIAFIPWSNARAQCLSRCKRNRIVCVTGASSLRRDNSTYFAVQCADAILCQINYLYDLVVCQSKDLTMQTEQNCVCDRGVVINTR